MGEGRGGGGRGVEKVGKGKIIADRIQVAFTNTHMHSSTTITKPFI